MPTADIGVLPIRYLSLLDERRLNGSMIMMMDDKLEFAEEINQFWARRRAEWVLLTGIEV